MKKGIYFFNILIVLLLIVSVLAVGSSTGARAEDRKVETNIETPPEFKEIRNLTATQKRAAREACENTEDRKERIKCRLNYIKENKEEFEAPYSSVPEACRRLEIDSKESCRKLYQKSQNCYEKKGIEKNKCFKRLANFAKANLKDEQENRNQKARDYTVLLLYDIQEKVEAAIENDRIDSEAGANAIDKIVEIKEDILSGKTKREITPKMLELRTLLKNIKSTIDQENE